jgi:hypothetical protein
MHPLKAIRVAPAKTDLRVVSKRVMDVTIRRRNLIRQHLSKTPEMANPVGASRQTATEGLVPNAPGKETWFKAVDNCVTPLGIQQP